MTVQPEELQPRGQLAGEGHDCGPDAVLIEPEERQVPQVGSDKFGALSVRGKKYRGFMYSTGDYWQDEVNGHNLKRAQRAFARATRWLTPPPPAPSSPRFGPEVPRPAPVNDPLIKDPDLFLHQTLHRTNMVAMAASGFFDGVAIACIPFAGPACAPLEAPAIATGYIGAGTDMADMIVGYKEWNWVDVGLDGATVATAGGRTS